MYLQDIMNLLAITASQNVGHIDWEPYIPMIFTRLLRSLDLPVCYKSMKSARNQTLWSSSVASETLLQIDFFPSTKSELFCFKFGSHQY